MKKKYYSDVKQYARVYDQLKKVPEVLDGQGIVKFDEKQKFYSFKSAIAIADVYNYILIT